MLISGIFWNLPEEWVQSLCRQSTAGKYPVTFRLLETKADYPSRPTTEAQAISIVADDGPGESKLPDTPPLSRMVHGLLQKHGHLIVRVMAMKKKK